MRKNEKANAEKASAWPGRRYLMGLLVAVLLVLVGGFGVVMATQQNNKLNKTGRQVMKEASGEPEEGLVVQFRAGGRGGKDRRAGQAGDGSVPGEMGAHGRVPDWSYPRPLVHDRTACL